MTDRAPWPFSLLTRRPPDVIIGGAEQPYLRRWHLIRRNRWFNLYLHQFLRSDDDRALHDHPWWNASILLRGYYLEHLVDRVRLRWAPCIVVRWRGAVAHSIELLPDASSAARPVWTLFLTGPKYREWGFHCPKGWRRWQDFTADTYDAAGRRMTSQTGRGCD